jgi:alkylglycerol monooxygenase
MSPSQIIVLATPVFFLLIALEFAWGVRRRAQHLPAERRHQQHQPGHAQPDQRGVHAAAAGGHLHRRLFLGLTVPDTARLLDHLAAGCWRWCSTTSATTGCTAWATSVAVLWAAHVVHHQSQDYNLSTALRQTSSGALLGWVFYLPMAVAGVPPLVFGVVALIDLLYQFWVHTDHVPEAGLV